MSQHAEIVPTRLFVDMDGTLAVFRPVDKLETLYEKGYFASLAPHENVVAAMKRLLRNAADIEVFILSAYLTDSKFALAEKNAWLDRFLPELDKTHRVFLPCGEDKKEYLPGGIRGSDCLLDDYTSNLVQWQPPARGIKLLNAINHSKGTWEHDRIRYDRPAARLEAALYNAVVKGIPLVDEKVVTPVQPDLNNDEMER